MLTFRQSIDNNKIKILEYLKLKGKRCTSDICHYYNGQHEMVAVRKALSELIASSLIKTDNVVHMWQGKFYETQ